MHDQYISILSSIMIVHISNEITTLLYSIIDEEFVKLMVSQDRKLIWETIIM